MIQIKNILLKLYERYRQLLSYLFFSLLAAFIDIAIGYILLKIYSMNIIAVNTTGIIVSTGFHYLLVTRKTFNSTISLATLLVYLATFFAGILFQDLVIWLFYDIILKNIFVEGRFLTSKIISLALSFFVLFFIRKKSYNILNKLQNNMENKR